MNSARNDLKIAERLLEEMAQSTNFSELEEKWQYFLIRLEKAWDITKSRYQRNSKYSRWVSEYSKLRKKDPLLRYVHHARHVEMHTVNGSVTKPLYLKLEDKLGRSFSMREIKVTLENGKLDINLDTRDLLMDFTVNVVPTDPHLVRVKNRGVWYNPPCSHLGVSVPSLHPCFVGKLAIDFYWRLVIDAEMEFNDEPKI